MTTKRQIRHRQVKQKVRKFRANMKKSGECLLIQVVE